MNCNANHITHKVVYIDATLKTKITCYTYKYNFDIGNVTKK